MELFRTAQYGQLDEAAAYPVMFMRKTTAELTAMQTARTISIGGIYFDTTTNAFHLGVSHNTISAALTLAGLVGAVAITGGTINGTSVGASTRSTGAFTTLAVTATDSSGTPGNVTNNNPNGRAAFAAGASTVVVTNSSVAAGDSVHVQLIGTRDATLTEADVTVIAAGSFTVVGNANATANKPFCFTVVKA